MSTPKNRPIAVIGCGVIGLSTGIRLLEQRFRVTIIARELPPHTTSDTAAAVWYPYKTGPLEKVLRWARTSLDEFYKLSNDSQTGVSIIELTELFPTQREIPWWKDGVRTYAKIQPSIYGPDYPSAFSMETPLIETPVYMQWLMNRFQGLGGTIQQRSVSSIADLLHEHPLLVNCAGIGARELVHDKSLYPIRGQTVIVSAPHVRRCVVDVEGPRSLLYIVPRSKDCVLGGTAEENDWSLEVRPETASTIIKKCSEIDDRLRTAKVLSHKVGLRPGRPTVRLELERVSPSSFIIHNYGHGGAGFTLSWGCADNVALIANELRQKNQS
ncbi:MAG TPA: FAD-dependent oxidoreductase [Bacteroidota bacterium]|nr:FAD-dependent oxidoreductase [Bacteroidota bacterium]